MIHAGTNSQKEKQFFRHIVTLFLSYIFLFPLHDMEQHKFYESLKSIQ